MFVEQAGQPSTIPLFDETSAAVFACLCRLTDGDGRRALALLIDVYVTTANESSTPHDLTAFTDRARRLYLAAARSPAAIERVIADMHFVEHRPLTDIARVVEEPPERVGTIVDSLVAAPAADLRHNEVWFDDATRSEAQRAIADRLPHIEGGSRSSVRSRRRAGVIAASVAAAALIALVLWVRAGDDTGDAASSPTAPSTSTPASTSTAPAPTTAVTAVETTDGPATEFTVPSDTETSTPARNSVGYILDPPLPGYVGFGASSHMFDGDSEPFPISIWASNDVGPASGRWLAIEIDGEDPSVGLYSTDVLERLEVAGHPALMSTTVLGSRQLVVPIGDGRQIDVYSYGIDPDKIAALVAATTIGPNDTPTFGADAMEAFDGLDLVASERTSQSGLGVSTFLRASTSVQYLNPDTGSFVGIMTASQAPNDLLIASMLMGDFGATTTETVSIDGRNVLIATTVIDELHTDGFALWHAGANTIAIFGRLSMDDLALAVRSSRPATPDEWQALADAVPPPSTYDEAPVEGPVHSGEIGAVTTTRGTSWTIRLSDLDLGREAPTSVQIDQLLAPETGSSYQPSSQNQVPLPIDANNPLTHFETPTATILVAAFDAPTNVATMRVTLYRRTPVDVPVVAVPATALSGAAYVFSELVPYTVELLDANGAVLQTFNS